MYEHQRSPLDDWTRYGVRLPMFFGLGILLATSTAITLSFLGYVDPAAVPIGIGLACIGVWLIVEAFFKVDNVKCEEAAKYFQSKIIQNKWEDEMKLDKELLDLANTIPDEDIQQDFSILMQAVKQQCAISMINAELAKEGKHPVPDIVLPEEFPKSTTKRKYSIHIPLSVVESTLCSSFEKRFQKSSNVIFNSMPNIQAFDLLSKDLQSNEVNDGGLSDRLNKSGNIPDERIQTDQQYFKFPYSLKAISKNKTFHRRKYTCKTLSRLFPQKISNSYQSLSTPNLYCEKLPIGKVTCERVPSCILKDGREIINIDLK